MSLLFEKDLQKRVSKMMLNFGPVTQNGVTKRQISGKGSLKTHGK